MVKKKLRIAITLGDAAGIGPEVILKALIDPGIRNLAQFVIFGDSRYLDFIAKKILYKKIEPVRKFACLCRQGRSFRPIPNGFSPFNSALKDGTFSHGVNPVRDKMPPHTIPPRRELRGKEASDDGCLRQPISNGVNIYSFSSIKELEALGNDFKGIAVLDFRNLPRGFTWGRINKQISQAALKYIREAAKLTLRGIFSALVTAPVNKEAINRAGFRFSGHTEFLARISKVKNLAMMLLGGGWRVTLVTRHLPLKAVSRQLSQEKILEAIRLSALGLKRLGISSPQIAVAALNPHAGEGGILGKEEERIILPAIKQARNMGFSVFGPFPSDTLFLPENKKRYDAQVVMYHDQGLIPLKMSGFEEAVNVTWGLPFIRTSPGHGTAYEIAGQGKADPSSMKEAIKLAVKLAKTRK